MHAQEAAQAEARQKQAAVAFAGLVDHNVSSAAMLSSAATPIPAPPLNPPPPPPPPPPAGPISKKKGNNSFLSSLKKQASKAKVMEATTATQNKVVAACDSNYSTALKNPNNRVTSSGVPTLR
eukprot:SAG31_NODE_4018_length_3662_cov_2.628964_3_plen_123_part_00